MSSAMTSSDLKYLGWEPWRIEHYATKMEVENYLQQEPAMKCAICHDIAQPATHVIGAPDVCRWLRRFCKGCVMTPTNTPKVASCPVCREPATRGFEDFKWAQDKQDQLRVKCPHCVCFLRVKHMKAHLELHEMIYFAVSRLLNSWR